jgi:hypothetical protein
MLWRDQVAVGGILYPTTVRGTIEMRVNPRFAMHSKTSCHDLVVDLQDRS